MTFSLNGDAGKKWGRVVFYLILLTAILLRCYQYVMGRSLWEDETHLALNLMDHGYLRLLQPLDHAQAAPVLFLWGVKTFALLFGYGELALRALPFICSICTVPLLYFIVLELSGSRLAALVAFFLFAVNLALIYFSSELKPYTLDVSMYLLLIYLAVSSHEFVRRRRALLLAVAGCLALLLSSVAFVVLFCIACNWFMHWYREKNISRENVRVMIAWGSVFLLNFFTFIYKHPTGAFMKHYWSFAFLPTDRTFFVFLEKTLDETFFTLLLYASKAYCFPYVLLFLFLVAFYHIYRTRNSTAFLFICLPVLVQLVLSALKLYPFYYRFILYLLPCFMYLVAVGVAQVVQFVDRRIHITLAAALGFGCCWLLSYPSFAQFPLWFREIKPTLDFVNAKPQGMHLYVSEPVNAYRYYNRRSYAKKEIYKEIPWSVRLDELDEQIKEDSSYLILYIPHTYAEVIAGLQKQGRIAELFEFKSYGAAVVKPFRSEEEAPAVTLNATHFAADHIFREDESMVIWEGFAGSKPVALPAGNYSVTVISRGTAAQGIYPSSSLFVNDRKLGSFVSGSAFNRAGFSLEVAADTLITVKVTLDNDLSTKTEDRNVFVKAILFNRKK